MAEYDLITPRLFDNRQPIHFLVAYDKGFLLLILGSDFVEHITNGYAKEWFATGAAGVAPCVLCPFFSPFNPLYHYQLYSVSSSSSVTLNVML